MIQYFNLYMCLKLFNGYIFIIEGGSVLASLMIHQIVGEEYCKRNGISSSFSFLMGNLMPDLINDKKATHYSARCVNGTYTNSIKNKVDLQAFCEDKSLDSNFNKGMFLHLITDQVFFYHYLLNNPKYREIENEDQLWIHAKLYRDYYRNNKYLMDKYTDAKLYYLPSAAKQTRDDIDQMERLSNEDIDRIIDMCAGVDLEKAYETITQMTRDLLET